MVNECVRNLVYWLTLFSNEVFAIRLGRSKAPVRHRRKMKEMISTSSSECNCKVKEKRKEKKKKKKKKGTTQMIEHRKGNHPNSALRI
ncbi:hypothetical protein VN97_g10115 [Penicillium thymicola]|uniref:Uncharacterized protein n=1 Tax=Penicillium thymicola TaxID=293382 RepID=A0AAI9T9L8_PENTH|nr:hypothetical protein VN97_g10115 [Penicillium thymicola]